MTTSANLQSSDVTRLGLPGRTDRGVVADDAVTESLRNSSPVAIGVSGGKDSSACALATMEYLDSIGHVGPRVLIHSDLGRVEWRQSLDVCERLAGRLGIELVTVRRAAGDMMDRWLVRWANNVERYASLSCVKLILPWSTPAMRFCTSELKTAVICRDLIKRFAGRTIVSATGIRRDESSGRSLAPVSKAQAKLTSKTHATSGLDWHPIVEWTTPDVYAFLKYRGVSLHEAYTKYGMTRVSCAFCIMSSQGDLAASARCPDNADIYREMVALEIDSTFAFQGSKWLGDVAPELLDASMRDGLEQAKRAAAVREQIERVIPDHLLYTKGWPTVMPTSDEARMLANVRRDVAQAVGIKVDYIDADAVLGRFAELMAAKEAS